MDMKSARAIWFLAFALAAPAAAQEPRPAPVPAPAAKAGDPERARSLVQTLRRADDDIARRDIYTLGAAAIGPLAEALESEDDPAAWTRLEESFEGILRARLQDLEQQIGRIEREAAEQGHPGEGVKPQAGPDRTEQSRRGEARAPIVDVAEALKSVDADIGAAGYAAARELTREGAGRDEISLLARQRLFHEIATKLAGEVAAGDDAALDRLASRLAHLGPLAAPLTASLVRTDSPRARTVGTAARDRASARYEKLLSAETQAARDFAAESFFGLGELARPALERLAREGTPDERHRAARLLRRIAWSISDELYRRTANLLDGFEERPWRERRMVAYELEKQGGAEAVPTLRRILEKDPSDGVKVVAAESLARLGDPAGGAYLTRVGEKPLVQSPEVLAEIAMAQGERYLQIKRYDRAIAEYNKVLEIQPSNNVALYNMACAYALMGDPNRAFDFLDRSIAAGFTNVDHMEKDEDLASLRADPRWRKSMDQARLRKQGAGNP